MVTGLWFRAKNSPSGIRFSSVLDLFAAGSSSSIIWPERIRIRLSKRRHNGATIMVNFTINNCTTTLYSPKSHKNLWIEWLNVTLMHEDRRRWSRSKDRSWDDHCWSHGNADDHGCYRRHHCHRLRSWGSNNYGLRWLWGWRCLKLPVLKS